MPAFACLKRCHGPLCVSLYARWRLFLLLLVRTSKGKGRSDLLIPVQARLCLEEVTFQQVRMVADHFDSYLIVILYLYIILYALPFFKIL